MIFFSIPLVFFIYLVFRLVLPLKVSRTAKILAIVFVAVFSLQHLATRLLIGFREAQEFPACLLMFQGVTFCSIIIITLLVLLRDGYIFYRTVTGKLSAKVSGKPEGQRASRYTALATNPRYALLFCLCAVLLSAWGLWQNLRIPDIRPVEVTLETLPPELDGIRIVQISDLHASKLTGKNKVEAIVNRTNSLRADLVVLTGDMVDGTPENRKDDVEPLRGLRAAYGVFGIPGNHEYYADFDRWIQKLRSLGIHMLLNEHVTLSHNGQTLVLAGVTDPVAQRFGKPVPDTRTALSGAPAATTILLAHQPKNAAENANYPVNLQLSGHTHGGQVPGVHLIAKYMNNGFLAGLYDTGSMQLYISRGTSAWSGFPIRIATPAEITLITLRSAKS